MADDSIPDVSPEEERKAKNRARSQRYRQRHREHLAAQRLVQSRTPEYRTYQRLYKRASYARNPEKARAQKRASSARHRARIRVAARQRYDAHREQVLADLRIWRAANPTALRAISGRYRQKNAEKIRVRNAARRARKRSLEGKTLTVAHWRALCKAVGYRCVYCGTKFPFKALTQDHIVPLSKGGEHTLSNILPACQSCNSRKGVRAVLCPVQPFFLLEE